MTHARETDVYWLKISNTVDEIVACLEGVGSDDLDWSPLDDANSLYVLATHTMGNVRHNLLNGLCGLAISRDRDAEFVVTGGSAADIVAHWNELKSQISDSVEGLPRGEMDRERDHPRYGTISGHELLVLVATHAAEHYGQAQLTRDLLRAQRSG